MAAEAGRAKSTCAMPRLRWCSIGSSRWTPARRIKLVAVPLAGVALTPSLSADYTRRNAQQLTLKLAVAGDVPLVDFEHAATATAPVAQAVNAAVDGFMRASADAPCVRMSALKLELVLDVQRSAGGGFKVVVPAVSVDAALTHHSVNTLTLDWAHIESRALRAP